MNYNNAFQELRNNIIESGGEITYDESELQFTAGEREYYANEEDFSIHEDWYKLFNSVNGLDLHWKLNKDDVSLSGFFHLTHFLDLRESSTENKLWVDWYNQEDIEEMKKHKILEMLHGNDAYITVKFEEDGSYNLYFVDGDMINNGGSKELPKLPLNLPQYIQIVMNYFGVHSVRYHLHKNEFYQNPKAFIPEYGLLKEHMIGFSPNDVNGN
jgi:hypothetical protein